MAGHVQAAELSGVSLLSQNLESVHRGMLHRVATDLGMRANFIDQGTWSERLALFERGEVHIAWICGLAYRQLRERQGPAWRAIAAPVQLDLRTQGRPVYFSDVIVRAQSQAQTIQDLRGARWAFNDRGSFSGYALVIQELRALNLDWTHFATVHETGSHQAAIAAVLNGEADAAAIDSMVLDRERLLEPALIRRLRTLHQWGPNPAPPVAASPLLSTAQAHDLRQAFARLKRHPAGAELLRAGATSHYAQVEPGDYDTMHGPE